MNDQAPAAEQQATAAAPAKPPRRLGARVVRVALLATMTVALGIWAADWARTALLFVHETDARVAADMVSVSSRVDGWLVARPVGSGDTVAKGDTLAVIDSRDAEARLVELLAELDRIEAQRAEFVAEIEMVDSQTRSRILSERARLAASDALVEVVEHEFEYAEREFKRAERLTGAGVVAAKVLDEARTGYLTTQKELVRARAMVATARAMVDEARAARREIKLLERQRATLDYREAVVLARIDRQQLDIADRTMTAPFDGVVSRAFVDPGEYVEAGQRIALLHDPEKIYVEANIRETDIRRLALGQRVTIEVDAYPDRPFTGTVAMIGQAATSQFALLPSPNPSGNFTKVTQRLPVRIAVGQQDGVLRPGMMVEVFIHVDGD